MTCPRCRQLLLERTAHDLEAGRYWQRYCVSCGFAEDEMPHAVSDGILVEKGVYYGK